MEHWNVEGRKGQTYDPVETRFDKYKIIAPEAANSSLL
jgi:hypothetical protein